MPGRWTGAPSAAPRRTSHPATTAFRTSHGRHHRRVLLTAPQTSSAPPSPRAARRRARGHGLRAPFGARRAAGRPPRLLRRRDLTPTPASVAAPSATAYAVDPLLRRTTHLVPTPTQWRLRIISHPTREREGTNHRPAWRSVGTHRVTRRSDPRRSRDGARGRRGGSVEVAAAVGDAEPSSTPAAPKGRTKAGTSSSRAARGPMSSRGCLCAVAAARGGCVCPSMGGLDARAVSGQDGVLRRWCRGWARPRPSPSAS
jgi:hypothetical protein